MWPTSAEVAWNIFKGAVPESGYRGRLPTLNHHCSSKAFPSKRIVELRLHGKRSPSREPDRYDSSNPTGQTMPILPSKCKAAPLTLRTLRILILVTYQVSKLRDGTQWKFAPLDLVSVRRVAALQGAQGELLIEHGTAHTRRRQSMNYIIIITNSSWI